MKFYIHLLENIILIKRENKQGLDTAHKLAFNYAKEHNYDYLITLDADFSHDPAKIPNFLSELKNNPFVIAPNAAAGFLSSSEFLEESDFELVDAKLNAHQFRVNISGKLDFKPSNNTFLSLGGSFYRNKTNDFSYIRKKEKYSRICAERVQGHNSWCIQD